MVGRQGPDRGPPPVGIAVTWTVTDSEPRGRHPTPYALEERRLVSSPKRRGAGRPRTEESEA